MLSFLGAENAETGYRFEIVCRFPYRIKDFGGTDAESSWFFRQGTSLYLERTDLYEYIRAPRIDRDGRCDGFLRM